MKGKDLKMKGYIYLKNIDARVIGVADSRRMAMTHHG